MKRAITLLAVLAVGAAIVLAGAVAWLEAQTNKPGPLQAPVVVMVAKGTTGRALGSLLTSNAAIANSFVWRYFLWRRGGLNAKAGKHALSPGMTVRQVGDVLEAPPLVEDEPFVVVEGWRIRETDHALADKGWAKPGDYIRAATEPSRFKAPFPLPAKSLEGYLYPETYRFPPGSFTVDDLVQRQLDLFVERFYLPHQAAIGSCGRSLEELVVMASLLEREEPTPTQRPTVAGILWKRYDKKTPLGVDATSRYELEEWNDRKAFLQHLRDERDPYNTRTRPGLPPTALGATTLESLRASLTPESNPYWYYLHDASKQLHPSKNAQEHEALRVKYNVW